MSGTTVEDALRNIFTKCDLNETGVIEIDVLLDILISQDPNWDGNETVRDKFCRILGASDSAMITKEHFIKSLLDHAEKLQWDETEETKEESPTAEVDDKCSSSSSEVGESFGITPTTSTNSIEDKSTAYYVSEGEHEHEDVTDGISIELSESPHVSSRYMATLKSENISLQRRTDYLENENASLMKQVMSLEEEIARNEEESKTTLKKLASSQYDLELNIKKLDECEEQFNLLVEENKSLKIQKSQTNRDNYKLKELALNLESQVECTLNDKRSHEKKVEDLVQKLKMMTDLQSKSQEELDELKLKEKEEKETLEELIEQNSNLQKQLESSAFLVQDLKTALSTAHRELSTLKSDNLKNKMKSNVLGDASADNSVIFYEENFNLDDTVPFETSLLAELKEKECYCVCTKNLSFSPSSSISVNTDFFEKTDAETNTEEKVLFDVGTITVCCENMEVENDHEVQYKDVGLNCHIKSSNNDKTSRENFNLYNLKPKRSMTKWIILVFILLLLCFGLGFFSSVALLFHTLKHSPKSYWCVSSVFDILRISSKYSYTTRSIY